MDSQFFPSRGWGERGERKTNEFERLTGNWELGDLCIVVIVSSTKATQAPVNRFQGGES